MSEAKLREEYEAKLDLLRAECASKQEEIDELNGILGATKSISRPIQCPSEKPRLPRVSLQGMAIRGCVVALEHESGGLEDPWPTVKVRVDLFVPSSTNFEPIRTSSVSALPAVQFFNVDNGGVANGGVDDEGTRRAVREIILIAIGHEIDEWLAVDGKRKDPHGQG